MKRGTQQGYKPAPPVPFFVSVPPPSYSGVRLRALRPMLSFPPGVQQIVPVHLPRWSYATIQNHFSITVCPVKIPLPNKTSSDTDYLAMSISRLQDWLMRQDKT